MNLGAAFGGFMAGRAAGTKRTDETVDRLNDTLEKFSDTLQRLISSLDNQARKQGGGFSSGTQQSSTRIGNGGGVTFGGQAPGAHAAGPQHRAPGQAAFGYGPGGGGGAAGGGNGGGWSFGGGGAHSAGWGFGPGGRATQAYAAAGGASGIAASVGKAALVGSAIYTYNHYAGMDAGQTIAAQYGGGGERWKRAYQSMIPGNYTAHSATDAMQSMALLGERGGFTPTSSGFASMRSGVLSTSLVDPAISNVQSAQAYVSMQSVGTLNRAQGMGMDFRGKSNRQIAQTILARIPGSRNIRNEGQLAAAMAPSGGISVTLQDAVRSGLITQESEQVIRSEMRGILKAQIGGTGFSEYNSLMGQANSRNTGTRDAAVDRLKELGIANSTVAAQRTYEGAKRDTEASTVEGFTAAVNQSTGALERFRGALNEILDKTGAGRVLGYGSGVMGSVPGLGRFLPSIPGIGDGPGNMASSAVMYASSVGGDGPSSLSSGSMSYGGAAMRSGGGGAAGGRAGGAGSRYNLGAVKPWVAAAANHLGPMFGISTVYGFGQRGNVSDHPKGLALDFMCGKSAGDRLASYARANHKRLNITYIIWRQRIWSINNPGWRRMEDRGSPTANHMDHVHISFLAAPTNPDLGGLPSGGGIGGSARGAGGSGGLGMGGAASDLGGSEFTSTSMGGASSGYGYGGYSEAAALGLGGGGAGVGSLAAAATGGGGGSPGGGGAGASHSGGGLRVMTANLNWARGRDKNQLRHLTDSADILLLQEANDVDLDRLLPRGWKSNQNMRSSGTMGSAIAWNASKLGNNIGRSGLAFGATQSSGGRNLNTRYLSYLDTNLNGQQVRLISGHFPLNRLGSKSQFEDNLREVIQGRPKGSEWLFGTDANQSVSALARRLNGIASASGIIGQIRSKGLRAGGMFVDRWGEGAGVTDHPYVGLSIRGSAQAGGGRGGSVAENIALGKSMAAGRGWTGAQWNALRQLWMRESGWRTNADNPTSSAYGIPQALTALHNLDGTSYMTDPRRQIAWGLNYIKGRYGNPTAAWNFWQKNHWYDSGEWNIRDDKDARVHKGEMIIPTKVAEAVRNELTAPGIRGVRGGGPQVSVVFQSGALVVQMASGATEREGRAFGNSIMETIANDERWKTLAKGN